MQKNYLFEEKNTWPPQEDHERQNRYYENHLLASGQHNKLARLKGARAELTRIPINIPHLIVNKTADFLLGKGLTVSANRGDNSPEQKALERIFTENGGNRLMYEIVQNAALKGDSFVLCWHGRDSEAEAPRVHIQLLQSEYVFPEVNPYDKSKIDGFYYAVPVRGYDKNRKEIYTLAVSYYGTGFIERSQYETTVLRSRQVRFGHHAEPYEFRIGKQIGETLRELTGINRNLITHIPNERTLGSNTWAGIDDITRVRELLDEIESRYMQASKILDAHSEPNFVVPEGTLQQSDEYGLPRFNITKQKVFEIPDGAQKPEYITWNASLDSCFREIDALTKLLWQIAEMPELGMDGGLSGVSGTALEKRSSSIAAKVQRKKRYFEDGLKRIFTTVQELEHVLEYADYEIVEPSFRFGDSLPVSEQELTNTKIMQIQNKLESKKSAIMTLFGITEEQALAKMEEIRNESQVELVAVKDLLDGKDTVTTTLQVTTSDLLNGLSDELSELGIDLEGDDSEYA